MVPVAADRQATRPGHRAVGRLRRIFHVVPGRACAGAFCHWLLHRLDRAAGRLMWHSACTAISASASDLSSIRNRSARRRLSHHPIEDRHRLRRRVWQGLAQRHAIASRFPAGAPHRFHLRRARRGIRPDRHGDPAVLYGFLIVRGLYIATQAQDTFTRLLAGTLSADLLRLRAGQHRHGHRTVAGGRRAATADQLRRHVGGDPDDRIRYAHVHTHPP